MIVNFKDQSTEKIWNQTFAQKIPPELQRIALRKMILIHGAAELDDLKIPPGNKLETLKGDRKGQHSIRINNQFRICFVWKNNNVYNVEITDYH